MKKTLKDSAEYGKFERALGNVLKVSPSEMKAMLEAEKAATKKRKSKTSASGRASCSTR